MERYTHSDRAVWAQRLQEGQIQINGNPCHADTILSAGILLTYHRPPWDEPEAPRDFQLLYEDEDVVAVEKPSGLQVLPAAQFLENTLLHVVRERLGATLDPVHRLGRGTSGIVLFARSDIARKSLSEDLGEGRLHKIYRALVQGVDLPTEFTVNQAIGAVPYPALGFVWASAKDGKKSVSHVRVRQVRTEETLVDVDIPTGRPHQIRIHLAAAGHPLVGEPFYQIGGHPPRVGGHPSRDASGGRPPLPGDLGYHLHAAQVVFDHPTTRQPTRIDCIPPPILQPTCADSS